MKRRKLLSTFLLSSLLHGCAVYHPLALDEASIAGKLAPPDLQTIRIAAREIRHPILKPMDFNASDGLSPDEAAILAVLANLKLRAARDQRELAQAQLLQAGILPNPQLSYALGIPTGGATEGTVNAYNFDFNWELKSILSRGANVSAAKENAASVDLDVAWQEWQIAEAAKLHVYHLHFFDQQLAIAGREQKSLAENFDRIKRAFALGFVTRIDLAAADAALAKMRSTVLTAEQQREEERLALNQSVGFGDGRNLPIEKNFAVPSATVLPPSAELSAGIEQRRLDLLALKRGYEAQEQRLRAAILGQFPKISIGFQRARDNSDVITTGFGVTIDIPLFDRNQGAIAVENATRTRLFDEYVARLVEARGEVARLTAGIDSLNRQIDATQALIPTLQNLIESYRTALLQGNADVLTYYNARADLVAKQLDVVDLNRQLADMYVALEIASGRYLHP